MRNCTANIEITQKLSLIASSHSVDNQRCQARTVARSLSCDSTETSVHFRRFISCRFDYCNALSCHISGRLIQYLQSVQNTAARLPEPVSETTSHRY